MGCQIPKLFIILAFRPRIKVFENMEEPVCSIEIAKDGSSLVAKVQSKMGRYVEFEDNDIETLLEKVYEDVQMEVQDDYW